MASKIKVDNIANQSDSNIVNKCGTTITLGASGDTINLASGASQTGFGREGSVDWQTGSIKTATFTAVSGEGYFINQGSQITANLPAGSAGAIVAFSDYARNFATYNLLVSPNGSEKIGGVAQDAELNVNGQSATFVYVDATKGWVNVQNAEDTETGVPPFVAATGGTITECGDYKIHTFTGPGTFAVTNAGAPTGSTTVDYLVTAGGGGASAYGGGGAGGFRYSNSTFPVACAPGAPLATPTAIPVSVQSYTIAIGAGGSGVTGPGGAGITPGTNSTFSTITSAGGGRAGNSSAPTAPAEMSGGSGGGGFTGACTSTSPGGTGNTPPVSPSQGNNGGSGQQQGGVGDVGGAGGGAIASGGNGALPGSGGSGGIGAGIPTAMGGNGIPSGGYQYYAGGGGAASNSTPGSGGLGGGGDGKSPSRTQTAGGTNTGGGGGGGGPGAAPCAARTGGSGIVVIRYKFQ